MQGIIMNELRLPKIKSLKGEIIVPPDKSISHRAVIFASIAKGKSVVRNFLWAEDPVSSMNAMRSLGVEITADGVKQSGLKSEKGDDIGLSNTNPDLVIHGKGLNGLKEPFDILNCGNSGTTIRLLSGILAGNPFFSILTGDDSLKQRPMARIITPLREMGACITGRAEDKYPPFAIRGGSLKAVDYKMPVSSAQVKSCLMLAALYAQGTTSVSEPFKSRDHSERMLKAMGAQIKVEGTTVRIVGQDPANLRLTPFDITVPSDFSSAAFLIAAALLVSNSEILIKGVGINPTRTGLLSVLSDMGAEIILGNMRDISGEPVADIYCRTAANLRPIKIGKEIMPLLIDEFPILCVLASQAEGISEIRGAEELRVKESDRIKAMVTELRKIGVDIEEYHDGVDIKGKSNLKGSVVESYGDHRIAMSLSVAGLIADGYTTIRNPECVDISFPGFYERLRETGKK